MCYLWISKQNLWLTARYLCCWSSVQDRQCSSGRRRFSVPSSCFPPPFQVATAAKKKKKSNNKNSSQAIGATSILGKNQKWRNASLEIVRNYIVKPELLVIFRKTDITAGESQKWHHSLGTSGKSIVKPDKDLLNSHQSLLHTIIFVTGAT